ncbi:glycoside hydrolase family 9 protein [Vibrio europaeus]|uniref:glycoside hydrolase family 9 protein n=1 Tax=Vibrio europaeus TaxID=300876 RepID=UPI00148E29F1|nr:glycoside hydrolase family 9 protein [Vibrio europaeus]MDC5851056.1 glycoside hydrolase family 9 protein [Vibrio europaeus]NOH24515.1 chitobiase [Vibrio europaeus]
MLLLTNHIGYEALGPKQAVLMTGKTRLSSTTALLVCADSHQTVATFAIEKGTKVANWHQGSFFRIEFSDFEQAGRFYLRVENLRSEVFAIEQGLLLNTTFSDLLHYFKSQRCGGRFDKQDKQVPILGSDQTVDVQGGWYDASGDVSKYLSHLSYANYLNPQQTPMVVWNMLKGLELVGSGDALPAFSKVRLVEEALFGADFLVRMQNEAGYFYMTVFDKWSKDTKQREICAYATQEGHKSEDHQAGFRQGGGISIAALAQAARLDESGEFTHQEYLAAAEKGYWHLKEFNRQYLDDGQENIIDEYCALLAVTELLRTTENEQYLEECRYWSDQLISRQQSDQNFNHYWAANQDGSRPYYHAAEAGLPIIALCEYLNVEPNNHRKSQVTEVLNRAVKFELTISNNVANPFGYPRQYVKSVDGEKRDAFFVAQNNETGYWWQGENARLGSLSSMAFLALAHIEDHATKQQLLAFAQNSLNWILGLNPYHMCMLDGHGINNPDYLPLLGFFNAKGGICNGITAGFEDENDIAFNPEKQKDDMLQNWRWGEQWIPHGAWYLLAIVSQFAHFNTEETTNE